MADDNETITSTAAPVVISDLLWASKCGTDQPAAWIVFMASSVAFPVALAIVTGIWKGVRLVLRICQDTGYDAVSGVYAGSTRGKAEDKADWQAKIKGFCAKLVSGTAKSGKIMVLLEFLAGMTALAVYFHQVSRRTFDVEFCVKWLDRRDWQIEFACNLFLLIMFGLRFVAANEKFWFIIRPHSIVDYCTIPPALLTLYLDRGWLGLRCLRAWHLVAVPEILQYFNVLKTRAAIRLAQLTCQILAVLLVASGIFHLVESTNHKHDFTDEANVNLSYWEFVYFSVVTLSTVGYGDISPKTMTGRLLCCLFIVSALALFASAIPEVFVLLSTRKRHGGPFKAERGTGHIVVTGHITLESMTQVMNEFHRKDYRRDDLKLVFVDFAEPDIEMESYLTRHSNTIIFLQGSLVRVEDLRRAKVQDALACLVMTNKNSVDPGKDDSSAIMTITSIKNYSPSSRCIVQILHTKTKNLLVNIPTFSVKRGDAVICFQELELALIAQSCLSPGCGTLLLNLCAPASEMDLTGANQLVQDYAHGCQMDVHLESFSPFFVDMTFCEAALFCKSRLDVLLIGLFKPMRDNTKPGLLLCPTEMHISSDRIGIFVGQSERDVTRARDYCDTCHKDIADLSHITSCQCAESGLHPQGGRAMHRNPYEHMLSLTNSSNYSSIRHSVILKRPPGWEKKLMAHLQDNPTPRDLSVKDRAPIPMSPITIPVKGFDDAPRRKRWSHHFHETIKLDISSNFYWCPARTFHSVALTRTAASLRPLKNHIVVLILAHADDPPLGLRELVVPLRSSRIPLDELKEVVFVGNSTFLEREWPELYNLPKITMVKGDPLSRADLRAVSIRHCAMCVILAAWTGTSIDPILDDKAAILAALNVKAMPFDEEEAVKEQPNGTALEALAPTTVELGPLLAEEEIPPYEVPLTVELQHQVNVRLLDDSDQSETTGQENSFLMEPFLTGQAVVFGTLDSLMVTSFRNPLAVPIMQQLLYGFKSPLLENLLAEGVGLVGGDDYTPEAVSQFGTRIRLMPIQGGPWTLPENKTDELKYVTLFEAATQVGILCLGISRKFSALKEYAGSQKRCVITNPSRDYLIRSDDLIFILSR